MNAQKFLLQTQRLTIRHIEQSDWEALQMIWEDMNASPYAKYDRPHSTDSIDVRERIARWAKASAGAEHIFFAICLRETLIGYISFNIRDGGYEIGYGFHSAYHGMGFAGESLSALMAHMKAHGVIKLTAGTALENTPSVRLLTSLGFRLTQVEQVSFYKDENGKEIVFDGGVFEKELCAQ